MKWLLLPLLPAILLIGLLVVLIRPDVLDAFSNDQQMMFNRFNKWNR